MQIEAAISDVHERDYPPPVPSQPDRSHYQPPKPPKQPKQLQQPQQPQQPQLFQPPGNSGTSIPCTAQLVKPAAPPPAMPVPLFAPPKKCHCGGCGQVLTMSTAWVSKRGNCGTCDVCKRKVAEGENVWVCGGCKWWTCSGCKARDQQMQMLPPTAPPPASAPGASIFDLAQDDLGVLGNEFAQMSNKRQKP